MNAIISILLGAVITVMALFYLKHEIRNLISEKNSVLNSIDQTKQNDLIKYITGLEKNIDLVNESFYEIVADLEGKYSVHEKKIELLDENIDAINVKYKTLRKAGYDILDGKSTDQKVPMNSKEPRVNDRISKKFSADAIRKNLLDEETIDITERDIEALTTREKIVLFRSEGLELHQIAKKLSLGVGEIKLILNMKG